MDQATRPNMESQGYLGNSRVILNHFDAATQADIQHTALSYESEDEAMGRWRSRTRSHGSSTPLYSKQDIREQYCISERGLGTLEANRASGSGLFGCLAGTQVTSPCAAAAAARANLLTVCVRRRVPSDENLYELCRRQPKDYAPMPRYYRYPWATTPADLYRYDEELACSYFRRRPRSLCGSGATADPSRYTWLPLDEESSRLERPRPICPSADADIRHSIECLPPPTCLIHPLSLPPPPVPMQTAVHRPKHVSFARSHTLTSFDDAVVSLGSGSSSGTSGRLIRSQERLLDGRKTANPAPITKQPELSESNRVLVEKLKRAPMKTQATQTEVCLGRKPVSSAQLKLSPRTIHRVKMVSQGAQTNGVIFNGRKLMKSYSEAGGTFSTDDQDVCMEHEPLQRTQSEEPPRSPFIVKTPSPEPDVEPEIQLDELPPLASLPQLKSVQPQSPQVTLLPPPILHNEENSSPSKSDHESDSETKSQKEIIIDFEPQIPSSPLKKKPLLKTSSDGEILLDKRKAQRQAEGAMLLPDKNLTSVSHDNISVEPEPRTFIPYFRNSPIRHENIFKDVNPDNPIFSSLENDNDVTTFRAQDSLDEEFHENLIYGGLFRKRSSSSDQDAIEQRSRNASNSPSPEEDGVVPTLHLSPNQKVSPFASTDSLANDFRDHSDGIWNESQVTVLPADSSAENGNETSGTLGTLSPGSTMLLTPSSKRKHLLLLQHQQRSSMDTDALDEEIQSDHQQSQPSPVHVPVLRPKDVSHTSLLAPPVESSHSITHIRRLPGSPGRARRNIVEPSLGTLPMSERYSDSALGDLVPDLLLARTDSGKTNTDLSESTTTEDYMTATSGTDSSRRSGSFKGANERHHRPVNQDGSSFESASSIYSVTRGEHISEDMVVPSFSPPPILEETSDAAPTPVPGGGRGSRTASSSSSGSYSLDGGGGGGGSCPDLHAPVPSHRPHHPTPPPSNRQVPSVSDDERSVHYSSSGYYESPLEEDSRANVDQREWTDEEKKKKKRAFTLDIHKHQAHDDKKSPHKSDKDEVPTQISPRTIQSSTIEKPSKKTRIRNRSPMQGKRMSGGHVTKRSPPGPGVHTSTHHDLTPDDAYTAGIGTGAGTSDESSSGVCGDVQLQIQNQTSPRKNRKIRETNRRKSAPKSPTTSKSKRRNGSSDDKPASLPGTLPRRRTKHDSNTEENNTSSSKSNRLNPYSRSPSGSPSKRRSSKITSPESARLKALSAESLRSVSPGSDSVFYSDPSSHAAAPLPAEHQVHCLHCGKEVDIVTTDPDPDLEGDADRSSGTSQQQDIVQPPAGFADSPRLKHGRLYKKLEKRFRSEERAHAERRHHKYRSDVRAKSEERCSRSSGESKGVGAGASRAAGSSPSLLATSPDADSLFDEDTGIYAESYRDANWVYIGDSDEMHVWNKSDPNLHQHSTSGVTEGQEETEMKRRDSVTSTDSEHEFRKRFEAVTHRMVHRKSCLEMYKRQASKSFESDKTIIVRRESGEFGFRIHGSKPVVVSAIEPDTPAESCGLEVGDIILSVNGVSVLEKSHNEVVKIAHAGSDTLTLEVARTCGVLSPPSSIGKESPALFSGYMWRQGGNISGTPNNKWIRRWFCLKKDNCLYTYKTDLDQQPVGALLLVNYTISRCDDSAPGATPRPFRITLRRQISGAAPLHLAADTEAAAQRWLTVLSRAAEKSRQADAWLEQSRHNLAVSPSGLHKPDCFGYLNKLGSKWKTWTRRYCVLKDACMYFYHDANSNCSYGMACLHGYKVQQSTTGGKKHAFEILPTEPSLKHFYFYTESEMDRKRWLAALEYSIDRWLKVG